MENMHIAVDEKADVGNGQEHFACDNPEVAAFAGGNAGKMKMVVLAVFGLFGRLFGVLVSGIVRFRHGEIGEVQIVLRLSGGGNRRRSLYGYCVGNTTDVYRRSGLIQEEEDDEEDEFCAHCVCFSHTNILRRTPLSQGRKYGKKRTGRSTVNVDSQLRRSTGGVGIRRNTCRRL